MNYYNALQIKELTGLSKSAVYNLIKVLNTKLKKEYPGTIILNGKVPKWYADKKLKLKEVEDEIKY